MRVISQESKPLGHCNPDEMLSTKVYCTLVNQDLIQRSPLGYIIQEVRKSDDPPVPSDLTIDGLVSFTSSCALPR